MKLSVLISLIAACQAAPMWSNNTLLLSNVSDPIIMVQSADAAFDYPGMVYIQETGEICGDGKTTKASGEFEATAQKYCVSGLSNTRTMMMKDLKAPVAPCLDSSMGDGGSITKGLSISVGVSAEIDPSLAMPIMNLITLGSGISAGVSVGVSFSHSCTAAAGDSIQMWVTPIVGLTDFRYRSYKKSKFGTSFGSYKDVSDFKFPVGGFQPAVECLRGEYVDCGLLVSNKFILENPQI